MLRRISPVIGQQGIFDTGFSGEGSQVMLTPVEMVKN